MSFWKRYLGNSSAIKNSAALIAVASLFLISGCSVSEENTHLEAVVKPNVVINLPQLNVAPFSLEELLTAHYGSDTQSLLTVLESNGHNLGLEVLTPTGIRLIGANYDGHKITTTKYINIDKLPDANQVLFDILLCHAQINDIQKVLPPNYTVHDDALSRTLSDDKGEVIYRITYQPISDAANSAIDNDSSVRAEDSSANAKDSSTNAMDSSAHTKDSNYLALDSKSGSDSLEIMKPTTVDTSKVSASNGEKKRIPSKIENMVVHYTIELQQLQ